MLHRRAGRFGLSLAPAEPNWSPHGPFESPWRLDEAEPLYREALAGLRSKLGDAHPHTRQCARMTAGLQAQMGGA